jgi:hypothetical protein
VDEEKQSTQGAVQEAKFALAVRGGVVPPAYRHQIYLPPFPSPSLSLLPLSLYFALPLIHLASVAYISQKLEEDVAAADVLSDDDASSHRPLNLSSMSLADCVSCLRTRVLQTVQRARSQSVR